MFVVKAIRFEEEISGKEDCEEQAYVNVEVMLAENDLSAESFVVSVVVGCPDYHLGSMRASGSDIRPFCSAWWAEASDWVGLPSAAAAEVVLDAIEKASYGLYREAVAARPVPEKGDVAGYDWETVRTYHVIDGDDASVAYEVEVQVGAASIGFRTGWFVRTTDDAGGSDEASDDAYASREAAEAAADALAYARDETKGMDADDWRVHTLEVQAGWPDPEGEWCVFWSTVGDDEHVVDRYGTREAAEAAATLANDAMHAKHPGGNLLCGFEVRYLDGDKWVCPDAAE